MLSHSIYNPTTHGHRATTTPHASSHSASQDGHTKDEPQRAHNDGSFSLRLLPSCRRSRRNECEKVRRLPSPTTCSTVSPTTKPPHPKHKGLSYQEMLVAAAWGLPCKTAPSTRRRGWYGVYGRLDASVPPSLPCAFARRVPQLQLAHSARNACGAGCDTLLWRNWGVCCFLLLGDYASDDVEGKNSPARRW